MGARIKLTVSLGDSTFSARGHLLYLIGERYEVGFVKPYDRYLGNFYVVPDQIIYWDTYGKPKRFGIEDTVLLSELLPLGLPDWDPRDLLPFPVSGRSTGFQPDSIWSDKSGQHVTGMGGDVRHDLALSSTRLLLTEETVRRPGREPVVKRYKRFRTLNGWPVPTKVTCADRSGITVLTWTLSDVRLDAEPFSPVPVESGEANTGARP